MNQHHPSKKIARENILFYCIELELGGGSGMVTDTDNPRIYADGYGLNTDIVVISADIRQYPYFSILLIFSLRDQKINSSKFGLSFPAGPKNRLKFGVLKGAIGIPWKINSL